MEPDQTFVVRTIQPLGTGHIHTLEHGPDPNGHLGTGIVRCQGVPSDLVARFLGRRFTRAELDALKVRFLRPAVAVVNHQGQGYLLTP
jgi:hypothetical protein